MTLSRRDFVKALGAGAAVAPLYWVEPANKALALQSDFAHGHGEKAMLYDASKCTGCRACQTSCKQANQLPAESIGYEGIYDNPYDLSAKTWTLVKAREFETGSGKELLLCKYQCMHCTDAACVKVCPTGALRRHQLGFVAYDQSMCSGCGYCSQFCPFQVPRLSGNTVTGQQRMQKCTFCADRVVAGQQPACAEACPAGAIVFGNRSDLVGEGGRRVAGLRNTYANATLYGEKELGGLHAMYVLKELPVVYNLPSAPEMPSAAFAWQSVIKPVGSALVGLTLLGLILNYLVARGSIKNEKERQTSG